MMSRYKHLHDKIRSTRKSLGLKQREFIERISKELGRGDKPLSQGLVSQWESCRTTPTDEQIVAIAKLTPTPWWTMLWFMHDDLPENRGVDYHQDGSFEVEPQFSTDELEADYRQWQKEQNAPPVPEIVAWESDPKKIHALRKMLEVQSASSGVSGHPDSGESTKDSKDSVIHSVTVKLSGTAAVTAVGTVSAEVTKSAESQTETDTPARRPSLTVEDLVEFPKPRHSRSNESSADDELPSWLDTTDYYDLYKKFDNTVEYFLGTICQTYSISHGFYKPITSGPIKIKPFFYFQGVSVIKRMLEPSAVLFMLSRDLKDYLGQLLLIDRIQNRAAKKMVLFCTYDSRVDLQPLVARFDEVINSCKLLGITVAFANGPEQTALQIAKLLEAYEPAED
jgi:transcriptional regulator with XRE-family HTH domain